MTLPKVRKRKYKPRYRKRKIKYPDDDTLVAWINFTNVQLTAAMLGITKMALSYFVRSSGLDSRIWSYQRRANIKKKRELLKLQLFNRANDNDKNNI